jgi:hypothetical protein
MPSFIFLSNALLELVEVVLVLHTFSEQIETLLDDVSTNKLENLVLLQRLTGAKVDVLRDKVFAIIHHEHASHVQLDVVPLFFILKYLTWHAACEILGDGIGTHECIATRRFGKGRLFCVSLR